MVVWSALPLELKQNVVKKLDFMSRNSLKNVCHTDRFIVNSSSLTIPCVRFGYKKENCLIVIYSGIEKFLRMEFMRNGPNEVVILKLENNMDPKLISLKTLHISESPLQLATSVLKSLVGHQSIKIKMMEFVVDDDETTEFVKTSSKLWVDVKLRIEVIRVKRNAQNEKLVKFLRRLCHLKEVKHFIFFKLNTSPLNLIPVMTVGLYTDSFYCNKPAFVEQLHTWSPEESWRLEDILFSFDLGSQISTAPVQFYIGSIKPGEDSKEEIRIENQTEEPTILYRESSQCGTMYRKVPVKYEKEVDRFKLQKCGLGALCSNCSEPFEHWYIKNLPRRLLHEPFWAQDELGQQYGSLLKLELELDEKRKNRLQEEMKIKKGPKTASWGFKSVPIDSLMASLEQMGKGQNIDKQEVNIQDHTFT